MLISESIPYLIVNPCTDSLNLQVLDHGTRFFHRWEVIMIWVYLKSTHSDERSHGLEEKAMGSVGSNDGFPSERWGRVEGLEEKKRVA
ncbi:hypothetical protein L484_007596 [Morus notabilis]|uniref:Uncharacterized protein n=1 Tax=Morus notabilis TaxID=981085 RepID=W9RJ09_9ROSA|nr:hypothetical protein L484_007596 [Morus notabilis]